MYTVYKYIWERSWDKGDVVGFACGPWLSIRVGWSVRLCHGVGMWCSSGPSGSSWLRRKWKPQRGPTIGCSAHSLFVSGVNNLNVPNSKCDRSLKLRSSLEWLVSIVWLLFWYCSSGVQKSDWDESVGFCANLCNSQRNAWNKILVNSQSYLLVLVWFGSVELQSMDSWNDKWLKACILPKWKSSRYGQKGN